MSFVSFLGGYSAAMIFTDEDNIDIDLDYENGNIFALDPSNFSITIEFTFNNRGYFDLEDLEVELELKVIYEWFNKTGDGTNVTSSVTIFDGDKTFKTINAGEIKKNKINIEYDDLEPYNYTDIALRVNLLRDPIFEFEAEELTVSAKYSLGLLSFKATIEDFNLGDFEEEV
jgi:hypothetical protein